MRRKMKKKATILNSALDGVPEITLYGDINEYDGAFIAQQIKGCTDKLLRISINSYGGDVVEAFEILSAMQFYQNAGGTIETVNTGRADSSAGWIFSAGTVGNRKIMQFAEMFFHAPLFSDGRRIEDLAEGSEERGMLENYFGKLVDIFDRCIQKTKAQIRNLMAAETELNAEQAVKEGFADAVIYVDNAPKLKNEVTAKEFCTICNSLEFKIVNKKPEQGKPNNNTMKIATLLNLNAEASEAAVRAEVEKILNLKNKAEGEVQNLTQANAELTTERDSLRTELDSLKNSHIVDYVKKLVDKRKDLKEKEALLLNMAKTDFDTFKVFNPLESVVNNGNPIDGNIDPSGEGNEDEKQAELAAEFAAMSPAEKNELQNSNSAKYKKLVNAYETQEIV